MLGEKGDLHRGGGYRNPSRRVLGPGWMLAPGAGLPSGSALQGGHVGKRAHQAPPPLSPPGVTAFTVAHLLYLWALGLTPLRPGLLLPIVPAFFLYNGLVLLHLPPGMVPMLVTYSLVLASMLWRGLARGGSARWGALLFTLSDSVLAWDAFVQSLPHARLVVMTTYYAAQLLIALSAVQSPRLKSR